MVKLSSKIYKQPNFYINFYLVCKFSYLFISYFIGNFSYFFVIILITFFVDLFIISTQTTIVFIGMFEGIIKYMLTLFVF
jgi:hypothetical protein